MHSRLVERVPYLVDRARQALIPLGLGKAGGNAYIKRRRRCRERVEGHVPTPGVSEGGGDSGVEAVLLVEGEVTGEELKGRLRRRVYLGDERHETVLHLVEEIVDAGLRHAALIFVKHGSVGRRGGRLQFRYRGGEGEARRK